MSRLFYRQWLMLNKVRLQLRWWLLGFGEYVEVIKPKALRDEFVETSQRLSEIYPKNLSN